MSVSLDGSAAHPTPSCIWVSTARSDADDIERGVAVRARQAAISTPMHQPAAPVFGFVNDFGRPPGAGDVLNIADDVCSPTAGHRIIQFGDKSMAGPDRAPPRSAASLSGYGAHINLRLCEFGRRSWSTVMRSGLGVGE